MEILSEKIKTLFVKNQLTLSLAESMTGGALAHNLTLTPGASQYFLGGVVAYSNASKQKLLQVQEATLKAHGAVSEGVAKEMAAGALNVFGSDVALSISGVAGPSGGSGEKPVGLAWCCLYSKEKSICWSFHAKATQRDKIIQEACQELGYKLITEIFGET